MASIGTVLTPQMKEQTIYVSDDGERFDSPEDCQLWERMKPRFEMLERGTWTDEPIPEEAEKFLNYSLNDRLDCSPLDAFQKAGAPFIEAAKDLKALSDWLWS